MRHLAWDNGLLHSLAGITRKTVVTWCHKQVKDDGKHVQSWPYTRVECSACAFEIATLENALRDIGRWPPNNERGWIAPKGQG